MLHIRISPNSLCVGIIHIYEASVKWTFLEFEYIFKKETATYLSRNCSSLSLNFCFVHPLFIEKFFFLLLNQEISLEKRLCPQIKLISANLKSRNKAKNFSV